jgi:hypothetical protein
VKARPGAAGFHVVGASAISAPLAGGVLVPVPSVLIPFTATPAGESAFTSAPLVGVPVGLELFIQSWFLDPAGPAGLAASNAVFASAP